MLSQNEAAEWICTKCGNINAGFYSFCTNCGMKRPGASGWICSKCGKTIYIQSYKFCIYCGAKREEEKKKGEPTPIIEAGEDIRRGEEIEIIRDKELPLVPKGYTIIQKISSKMHCEIFKARDPQSRIVALKLPKIKGRETTDETLYKPLEEEIKVWEKCLERLKSINHKNIIRVYEFGSQGSESHIRLPWISMEFMEGGSLSDKLRNGPLPLREALEIAIQIANALYYIHHLGLVHQDVKPENILFDKHGIPKLSDFGTAKILLMEKQDSEGFKGTLLCAAPEQLDPRRFGEVDWRTDIYGFGVTLYWMVTGQPPFYSDDANKCIEMIINEEPKPATKINKKLPKEIDGIFQKLLAKRKEDRYEDMAVVIKDLKRLLSVEENPR